MVSGLEHSDRSGLTGPNLHAEEKRFARKYFPKLVLANPAEFDGIWNEYVGEFSKLDVKGYEDLITEEVAKKIANAQGQ